MEEEKDLIFFKVEGTSMRPFFKTGDKFMVKNTALQDLKIGDIISYYTVQRCNVVCHRLIKKVRCGNGYILYTRGDSFLRTSVEEVAAKDLVGKVIAVIRNGRVTNLTGPFQRFVNRIIVIFLPFSLRVYNKIKKAIAFLK